MTAEIIYLFIAIVFVLLLTAIVIKIVVSHGKPTIINHGTIHNHYYGKQQEDSPKSVNDRTIHLIAEGVVETLKAINSSKGEHRDRNDSVSLR